MYYFAEDAHSVEHMYKGNDLIINTESCPNDTFARPSIRP